MYSIETESFERLRRELSEKIEFNIRRLVDKLPNGHFSIGFGLDLSFNYNGENVEVDLCSDSFDEFGEYKRIIFDIISLIDKAEEIGVNLIFSTNSNEYYEYIEPKLVRDYKEEVFIRYVFEHISPFHYPELMSIMNKEDIVVEPKSISFAWNELIDITKIPLDIDNKDLFPIIINNPLIKNKDIINPFRNAFKYSTKKTVYILELLKNDNYEEAKKYFSQKYDFDSLKKYIEEKTKISFEKVKEFDFSFDNTYLGIRGRKANELYGKVLLKDFIEKVKEI